MVVGSAPPSTSQAIRATRVVVLPDPAGATHNTGPGGAVAAARWSGVSAASRSRTAGWSPCGVSIACREPLTCAIDRCPVRTTERHAARAAREGYGNESRRAVSWRPRSRAACRPEEADRRQRRRSRLRVVPVVLEEIPVSRSRSRLTALAHVSSPCWPALVPAASAAADTATASTQPSTDKAIFFASDGMRPDLMEQYAAAGRYADLRRPHGAGVTRRQRHASRRSRRTPASAGTRWRPAPSRASTARRTTPTTGPVSRNFNNRTSFSAPAILQADTIAARRGARGQEGRLRSTGSAGATHDLAGPTVDFRNFFSTRGVLAAPLEPDRAGRRGRLRRISYQVAGLRAGVGLDERPGRRRRAAPPKQTLADRRHDLRRAEPEPHLRHLRLRQRRRRHGRVRPRASWSATGWPRTAARRPTNLGVGDFNEIKLDAAPTA